MQISFNCPNCSNVLQAESTWSGQQTQCPYCKNMIIIPGSTVPQEPIPPQNTAGIASFPPANKDFFLIRIFTSLFDSLRSTPFPNALTSSKNLAGKIGATSYVILGILLFIIACIRSSDVSSAWSEIFKGITFMLGLTVFSACGMYMFKLYDDIFEKSKSYSVPGAFLNTTAAISMCACFYYIVAGITETCIAQNGLVPLYTNLCFCMMAFPVMVVSLAPSAISISTKEQSTVDNAVGIGYFIARTALFAVPFYWVYNAVYRILNMLIHIGGDKSKLAEAYSVSSEGLPLGILFPVYIYIVYLFLDFTISSIKSFMDAKSK